MRTLSRFCAIAAIAAASSQGFTQQQVPIRTLTTPVASDSGIFRSVTAIRALSDGRVFVNDVPRRRIVLLDATLRTYTVIADTAAGAPNRYPRFTAGIFAFKGDSTIFVDPDAQALVVVDPAGKFGRVMASPRPSDVSILASSAFGTPGFDPRGRLVYRTIRRDPGLMQMEVAAMERGTSSVPQIFPARADSSPIIRADFDSRGVDTIAYMRVPSEKRMARGNAIYSSFNPLPLTDEWALLPDGTVAVVRYHDYHLDLWHPDGTKSVTPKIPFDWRPISLEQRKALLDSVKLADSVRRASLPPLPPAPPGQPPNVRQPIFTVDAEDMWDFYPPIRPGQVRVDYDGHIWILPSTSSAAGAGLVFDVVRRDGTLVERVRLPEGRNLIGFGPNQTVYMIYAPSPQRILLERATVVRSGT